MNLTEALGFMHKRLREAPKFLEEEYSGLKDNELLSILRSNFAHRKLSEEQKYCKQKVWIQYHFRLMINIVGVIAVAGVVLETVNKVTKGVDEA